MLEFKMESSLKEYSLVTISDTMSSLGLARRLFVIFNFVTMTSRNLVKNPISKICWNKSETQRGFERSSRGAISFSSECL